LVGFLERGIRKLLGTG